MIKIGKTYKYSSDMVRKAIKEGYMHIGGKGFACKNCKNHSSVRKFIKDKKVMYACPKCGDRWGSSIIK